MPCGPMCTILRVLQEIVDVNITAYRVDDFIGGFHYLKLLGAVGSQFFKIVDGPNVQSTATIGNKGH